jgi:hypothetical protein
MAALINWDLSIPAGSPGGTGSALGVSAVEQIKDAPGKLWQIVCVAPGTITMLDGTSGSGTTLYESASMTAGQTINLGGFPFFTGLYVSAVTGTFNLSFT